jgi:hypothetical protein
MSWKLVPVDYRSIVSIADNALDDVQKFLAPHLFSIDTDELKTIWDTVFKAREACGYALGEEDE